MQKCHTGQSIVFDSVERLGWSVDVRTHSISVVIDKVLGDPGLNRTETQRRAARRPHWRFPRWRHRPSEEGHDGDEDEGLGPLPKPEPEVDCSDCQRWCACRRRASH